MPNLLGDLGDLDKDKAALQALIDHGVEQIVEALPKLKAALTDALDGLTITVSFTVSRKKDT